MATRGPHGRSPYLKKHADRFREAGIPLGFERARGTRSIRQGDLDELEKLGFSRNQRTPNGLLIPIHNVKGRVALYQYRHQRPRRIGDRFRRYDTPRGSEIALDVHPDRLTLVLDPSNPLWVTEGILKADALAVRGTGVVGLLGVRNWGRQDDGKPPSRLMRDWKAIPLEGREVIIVPDSDVVSNGDVHQAMRRFVIQLRQAGARPIAKHVPTADDGSKQGIDDWLGVSKRLEDVLNLSDLDLFRPDGNPEPRLTVAMETEWERLAARKAIQELSEPIRLPESSASFVDEVNAAPERLAYVIDGWQQLGHNALLTSGFKVGKTTLLLHLTRCLCDDEPFLGRYTVALTGSVGFWNYEMTPDQFRTWLRLAGIGHLDRGTALHLRGARVPITTKVGEDYAVAWLQEHQVEYWVIDTFARAMADCGLDENSNADVERFTRALDVIKERAGVPNLIMSSHTGRAAQDEGKERARGATRLDDWTDERWILTQDGAKRFIRATGRDIEQEEQQLTFTGNDYSLIAIDGTRREVRQDDDVARLTAEVASSPGINEEDLRNALRWARDRVKRVVAEAERRNEVRVERGPKNAKLHYPMPRTKIEVPKASSRK